MFAARSAITATAKLLVEMCESFSVQVVRLQPGQNMPQLLHKWDCIVSNAMVIIVSKRVWLKSHVSFRNCIISIQLRYQFQKLLFVQQLTYQCITAVRIFEILDRIE